MTPALIWIVQDGDFSLIVPLSSVSKLPVVLSAHPMQVEVSSQVSAAERGSGLVLTCKASRCLRPPTLTWRRMDQNQTVLQRTQQEDGLSMLHLQDLDLRDQGGYSCEAECDSVIRTRNTQVHVYCESDTPDTPEIRSS